MSFFTFFAFGLPLEIVTIYIPSSKCTSLKNGFVDLYATFASFKTIFPVCNLVWTPPANMFDQFDFSVKPESPLNNLEISDELPKIDYKTDEETLDTKADLDSDFHYEDYDDDEECLEKEEVKKEKRNLVSVPNTLACATNIEKLILLQ